MIHINKLRGRMVELNITTEELSKRMGINRATLYRKLRDTTGHSFTVREVRDISRILELSTEDIEAIFFNEVVA